MALPLLSVSRMLAVDAFWEIGSDLYSKLMPTLFSNDSHADASTLELPDMPPAGGDVLDDLRRRAAVTAAWDATEDLRLCMWREVQSSMYCAVSDTAEIERMPYIPEISARETLQASYEGSAEAAGFYDCVSVRSDDFMSAIDDGVRSVSSCSDPITDITCAESRPLIDSVTSEERAAWASSSTDSEPMVPRNDAHLARERSLSALLDQRDVARLWELVKVPLDVPDPMHEVLSKFQGSWDAGDPQQMQHAVDMFTKAGTNLKIALTTTSYLELYRENIAVRLIEYGKYFSWKFDSDFSVRQSSSSTVIAEREGFMSISMGYFARAGLSAVMRTGDFPGVSSAVLENCNNCPAKLAVRLEKQGNQWLIDDILVLKV